MRYTNPGIVAYYWDGGAPKKNALKDISATGAYLNASEPWCVGTIITLTLQQEAGEAGRGSAVPFVGVTCRVVRHTPGGAGIKFMLRRDEERKALRQFMRSAAFQKSRVSDGLGEAGATQGQALLELVVVIPFLFLLMVNTVNFGGWLYSWVAVGNAARAAANYAALGSSSADSPREATVANVVTMTQTETALLPNWSSSNPTITVCQKYNGTTKLLRSTSACPAGVLAPPDDPEPTIYTNVAVDVTYTYTPFIPLFQFPSLGIYATIPPTTVHRRAVMRVLN